MRPTLQICNADEACNIPDFAAHGISNSNGKHIYILLSSLYSIQKLANSFSLLHSLMTRVASLRTSRGDYTGAQRARSIAAGFENSVKWWRIAGSMGWDYIAHYAWKESLSRPSDYLQIMSSFNELLSAYGELMQVRSEVEKVRWISQNYQRVMRTCKLLLKKLLGIFSQSGPLRESILAIQKEIIEGDLIGDLLQLGAADVKGLLQIAKDMISRFLAPSSAERESSHAEL